MSVSREQSARVITSPTHLLAFVLLAYALSLWPWIWYQYDPVAADAPILPFGPFLAAVIVLFATGGWTGLRKWLRKIVHWRVGWRWYAFALLLPVILTGSAFAINLALGSRVIAGFEVPDVTALSVRFLFIFVMIGLGEEPAWRGFALPQLMHGRSALAAALILGAIHVVWHAPLFGVEYDLWNVLPWGITVVCVSVVICWMWLRTGGSLLLPALLHTSNNTIALLWKAFDGSDQLRLWWIWCALWLAVTAALIWTSGRTLQNGRSQPAKT